MTEDQFNRFMTLIQAEFRRIDEQFAEIRELIGGTDRKVAALSGEVAALRTEMHERFESVDHRLTALERRVGHSETRLDTLIADVNGLRRDSSELADRVNTLSDDMRQRFRVLTERLAAVEQKLAA